MMFMRQMRKLSEMKNLFVVNAMCLFINLFIIIMQIRHGLWPVETYFQPSMNKEDKAILMNTLKVFVKTIEARNLTYLMYSGTLIGSYRHHGPIPWDDDVDLILNASQKAEVQAALSTLRPSYDFYDGDNVDLSGTTQWKFFSNSLEQIIHKPFKWPYLDIFFFRENETHIWDEVPRFKKSYVYAKSEIFPIITRPFGEMMLNAPCQTRSVLSRNYHIELCRSRQFSHALEVPLFTFSTKDIPCTRLEDYFPFVHRTYKNNTVHEELHIGEWSLQKHSFPLKCN